MRSDFDAMLERVEAIHALDTGGSVTVTARVQLDALVPAGTEGTAQAEWIVDRRLMRVHVQIQQRRRASALNPGLPCLAFDCWYTGIPELQCEWALPGADLPPDQLDFPTSADMRSQCEALLQRRSDPETPDADR